MSYRDNTKEIHIGNRVIGHGNPVLIRKRDTYDKLFENFM